MRFMYGSIAHYTIIIIIINVIITIVTNFYENFLSILNTYHTDLIKSNLTPTNDL